MKLRYCRVCETLKPAHRPDATGRFTCTDCGGEPPVTPTSVTVIWNAGDSTRQH